MTEPGPQPVSRSAPGRLVLRLGATERRILASLVAELRAELGDPASAGPGGSLVRLFPPAFPDDAEREAGYVDLVRGNLVEGRLERIGIVEASLAADVLDDVQASAWVAVLNDARLVLAAGLGLDATGADEGAAAADGTRPEAADAAGDDADPASPDAIRGAIFAYLGWLVGSFVDVLAQALPDLPDEVA